MKVSCHLFFKFSIKTLLGHLIHESSLPVATPLACHFQNKLMMAQQLKNLLAVQETQEFNPRVQSLGLEDPLEG